MTYAGDFGMGGFSHGEENRPRNRLRDYLERRYRARPGALAVDLGVSYKRAENLLLGHWPDDLTFSALMVRFGRDLRDAITAPDIDPVLARLTAEERQLEERLIALRARRIQAQGGLEGDQEPLASVEAEKDDLTLDLFEGRV